MIASDHRGKKRIFAKPRQKTSFWSRFISFFSSAAAVAIGAIVAMLFAEHLESGASIGAELGGWLNWFTNQITSVDPFVTVAVVAVLGLVCLAFYARDH